MTSEAAHDSPCKEAVTLAAAPDAEVIDALEEMETDTASKPSLSSIAKDLIRAKENGQAIRYESDEDENDDAVHMIKFGKILKLTSSKKTEGNQGQGEEDLRSAKIRRKTIVRNRRQLLKTLRIYFRSAFTILVRKRRLAPTEAFDETEVLGIKVPKFAHPASFEYVDEVAKKMIALLVRNALEGCVMHIMIEKNKTSHIIQRFVFKVVGSLDFLSLSLLSKSSDEDFDLEQARNVCRDSLLQILNQTEIKPILIPQFSRWSISVAIKQEFIASHDKEWLKELWQSDPSGHYFPWKERPRNPPCPPSQTDACVKMLTAEELVKRNEVTSAQNGNGTAVSVSEKSKVDDDKSVETMKKLLAISKPAPKTNPSSTTDSDDKLEGIICLPISSFPITAHLMFSVYSLDYPAPTPGPITRSLPESFIRSNRSSAVGSKSNASVRHRTNRQYNY